MKFHSVFSVVLLIGLLVGCATQVRPIYSPAKREREPVVQSKSIKNPSKPDSQALFQWLSPLGVQLLVQNLKTKEISTLLIEDSLFIISLEPGDWQIDGFILNDQKFHLMNTSQKFVFNIKKNKTTYAGSIVVQCPKIGEDYFPTLKKMKFFNRYYFSSNEGLCEMVVGNDYKGVKRSYSKTLIMGF